ncbi:arginyl-tRNA--protein arginylyltransferase [Arcicella rigui]|uniref:Arginyl-tRNA--protein arginylyltransferase n=1 Tax=Arcicella rigui TaxID=797020 RepID=A0ABU5Q5D5_9BACT|nr:arginyl-tRNA--protein arginylyltransferase [Arcicella rigui]MEA5137867.1 arginyl-tRNA--protein arginylyltransferase [Arcicella rigui]
MLAKLNYPTALHPKELDNYLAHGWFRMGQTIFTTNFLRFSGVFYSAIWLRIDLDTFVPSKTQLKLEKLNAAFSVEIVPVKVTATHEELFLKYKNHISFEAAPSLEYLLYHDGKNDIYNTYQVNIYDQQKLIATGFFDLGENTSAGISCFYDPDYRKYSLGKYLMLLKMKYSKQQGLKYFYPGYFAPGYPLFDYKLDLAKSSLEYYELSSLSWQPFSKYAPEDIPLVIMKQKLYELSKILKEKNITHTFFEYEFFDADLFASLNGLDVLDFPVFLYCLDVDWGITKAIIVFDLRDQQYHFLLCNSLFSTLDSINVDNRYTTNILKVVQPLFASASPTHMARAAVNLLLESE